MATKKPSLISTSSDESNNWRIEQDCRTLFDAQEIMDDPARLKAARDYAKSKVKDYNTMINRIDEESLEDDE